MAGSRHGRPLRQVDKVYIRTAKDQVVSPSLRFTILRLYSPLEPFFTKAWPPSELELVR
jgi:hypothetical protein